MPLDGNMCDNCKMATSVLKPLMDDQNTKVCTWGVAIRGGCTLTITITISILIPSIAVHPKFKMALHKKK